MPPDPLACIHAKTCVLHTHAWYCGNALRTFSLPTEESCMKPYCCFCMKLWDCHLTPIVGTIMHVHKVYA